MALAETAKLATVLTLKDGLTPGLNKPIGAVGKFGTRLDGAGKRLDGFGKKLKTAGAVAGGALAGGLLVGIRNGLENLGELESATTSVAGALTQMGKAGKVSAGQVADWANEIEAATDAAFDDKAITAATTTLLRFGKVTAANIRPAMEVMTDLAAKTGDVDSAASLLAKALADPTKAAGRLTRQGIVLTKAQEKQIAAFIKAGEKGKAQAVVLEAISKSTKNAARDMNGPYVDAQRKLADAVEDGTKALAIGFLPLITKVSEKLQKGLADKNTIRNIESFGKGLAGAFEEAVAFAEKVPWGAIADGIKTSAQWAGKLFDAFRSLPPETQGILVALAGVTKLTGGAPIKFAIDFAKEGLGRIFERGSSAANALWVKPVGGLGGVGGTGSTGTGKVGKVTSALGKVAIVGEVIGLVAAVEAVRSAVSDENSAIAATLHESLNQGIAVKTPAELTTALNAVNQGINDIQANPLNVLVQGTALDELKSMRGAIIGQLIPGQTSGWASGREAWRNVGAKTDAVKSTVSARSSIEVARLNNLAQKAQGTTNATNTLKGAVTGRLSTVSGKLGTANSQLAAIKNKRTSFRITVPVHTAVSVRNVNTSTNTSNNYSTRTRSWVS